MPSLFISYRRADSAGYVRALVNAIQQQYGDGQLFLDMESIEAGANFATAITEAISHCEVVLALIGASWASAANEHGRARLHDPDDFVRIEIASALRLGVPVLPVLLEDTRMPPESVLPNDLAALVHIQALRLSHARWDDDLRWLS